MDSAAPAFDEFAVPAVRLVVDVRHTLAALLVVAPLRTSPDVLTRLFGEFGMAAALGDLPCIVALDSPEWLDAAGTTALPTEHVIFLAPPAADTGTVAWQRLQGLGFQLMTQDAQQRNVQNSCFDAHDPYCNTAFALSSAMVDAVNLTAAAVLPGSTRVAALLRRFPGPHLALDVSTPAAFMAAMIAGCEWFVGDYAYHPAPAQQEQGPGRAVLLKLLALVAREADSIEIEATLKQSPELAYQLLKLVNSVHFGLTKKIANFGHALAMLGRNQLQRWLQLVLYAQPHNENPNPLLLRAVLRAGLMEALCKASGGGRIAQDEAFMVGMFSLLDILLGMPLATIIEPLNLAPEISAALLQRTGALGALLASVEDSEQLSRADTQAALRNRLQAVGLSMAQFCAAQIQAVAWARQVTQAL